MADRADFNIPVKTWVQVATNATTITIFRKDPRFNYFSANITTGGAAPTATVNESGIPEDAMPMFECRRNKDLILNDSGMDVYVTCTALNKEDTIGKVTVDA